MIITRATNVELVGKGTVSLKPSDHVATGGEGEVYRLDKIIVKLFLDVKAARVSDTFAKIERLSRLKHPYVVAPQGLVNNATGNPIGYYMAFAAGEPLARSFTTDWRTKNHFGDKEASALAAHMLEVVQFAHGEGAIMADANEFNWNAVLSRQNGPTPRNLDVDSWAIDKWPARAIMPSIHDWRTKGFTKASDYFSWGVVTFQLYTGIHPYKGRLDGYKLGDLERRMRDGASVFASGVKLNQAVRDFACIPGPLLDWYRATFQNGTRTAPPSPLATGRAGGVPVARVMVSATGACVTTAFTTAHLIRPYACFIAARCCWPRAS